MIRRETIDGVGALVAYLTDDMEPTDEASATLLKIIYDDGRIVFARNSDQDLSDEEMEAVLGDLGLLDADED